MEAFPKGILWFYLVTILALQNNIFSSFAELFCIFKNLHQILFCQKEVLLLWATYKVQSVYYLRTLDCWTVYIGIMGIQLKSVVVFHFLTHQV